VTTGLKDMELAATFCERAGVEAPLLQDAMRSVARHGAQGLRSNLDAVMKATRQT
jgi:hypothetical protein